MVCIRPRRLARWLFEFRRPCTLRLLVWFSSFDACERVDVLWMSRVYVPSFCPHLIIHSFTCIRRRKSQAKICPSLFVQLVIRPLSYVPCASCEIIQIRVRFWIHPVLCERRLSMYVTVLWVCIHPGQAQKFARPRWESNPRPLGY